MKNVKRILAGFNPNTKVSYRINANVIEDIKTVSDFLNNGLTTYTEVNDGALEIEDDTIIISVWY